jgi:mRNA interferase HigB
MYAPSVRIIKESFLKEAAALHPRAAEGLQEWVAKIKAGTWQNPVELAQSFPSVDPATVESGNTVYIFNIRRNEFRLIAAIHFNRQRVFTLRFMTHAEYDRTNWKDTL